MDYQHQILGTVVASVLDYDHLVKITGDPTVIDPAVSSWVPADGRSMSGSKLANLTGQNATPDLRGRFLRGLNTIYNIGQPNLTINTADVDDPNSNRKAGSYQSDAFALHNHPASGHINGSVCGSNNSHDGDGGSEKYNSDPNYGDHTVVVSVASVGGSETRPKNVAVCYYIKIN